MPTQDPNSRHDIRAAVQSGAPTLGSFVNLGSSLTAEIMGLAGFEWLVIDLEHGAGDEHLLLGQLQALGNTGAAALVRVEGVDPARIQHALDLGADGVMVPRIRSADEARRSVELCRYGGGRGVARYNRSWGWSLLEGSLEDRDSAVFCAIQIETVEALAAAEEIAAIDGVDLLFVGPADLSFSLGLPASLDDPELRAAVAPVAEAARKHGKAAGILVGDPGQARTYRELGFTFIACGADSQLLATGAKSVVGELREIV
jgi:2-keto-3-deoxy-L-rhamnonate aldolase RhmA